MQNDSNTKPERMTQMAHGDLVEKTHPRIVFRGKLDTFEAQLVLFEAQLLAAGDNLTLIEELEQVGALAGRIMRSEVLEEKLGDFTLLGFDEAALRDRSHHPEKYYGVKALTLPTYRMSNTYLSLNLLRAQAREVELTAVKAFAPGGHKSGEEIIRALNRMSSALFIMMCKSASGAYIHSPREC